MQKGRKKFFRPRGFIRLFVELVQNYFAALCAAAKRAIGTRYGLQLT
jgi:hypothetical protein